MCSFKLIEKQVIGYGKSMFDDFIRYVYGSCLYKHIVSC